MKQIMAALAAVTVFATAGWAVDELPLEEQQRIIENYLYATGQRSQPAAATAQAVATHEHPHKCGTPALLAFRLNYDRLDRGLLKSAGATVQNRPTGLTETQVSPSGFFTVHYATSGPDAIPSYIPDYIPQVVAILDSVYTYIIDTLGYPPPPQDGYEEGGDATYDVYIRHLAGAYFGMAYPDSIRFSGPGSSDATSWLELDNDPARFVGYKNRPMDAVRVTIAHEFFHAVQFGMDVFESEGDNWDRPYWMEMSAVWMEEQIYDDINDYYAYLPTFFNEPEASIQRFDGGYDYHPYASCIFNIYLTEKYNRDVIRAIWEKCADLGWGPSFLQAANQVIDSVSGGLSNWPLAMSEFALWNYLTGSRSDMEIWIDGVQEPIRGYSERRGYPEIPVEKLHRHYSYPVEVTLTENKINSPRVNGAYFVQFNELGYADIISETTYWVCDSGAGAFPNCTDSFQVRDTMNYIDYYESFTHHVDSLFNIYLSLGDGASGQVPTNPEGWGITVVYQMRDFPDSLVLDRFVTYDDQTLKIDLLDRDQYYAIGFILTPSSSNRAFYSNSLWRVHQVGYKVNEEGFDSTLVGVPPAVLDPYPNPAVVDQLSPPVIKFKFRVPTDTTSYPLYGEPFSGQDPRLVVDIFTVAGERVRTLEDATWQVYRLGEYTTEWDLRNAGGEQVASGVYIAYARLYSEQRRGELLAEATAKLAVIR